MAKRPAHPVKLPAKNTRLAGTIDVRDVEGKIRKPSVRPVLTHQNKKGYRRKPKHPTRDVD